MKKGWILLIILSIILSSLMGCSKDPGIELEVTEEDKKEKEEPIGDMESTLEEFKIIDMAGREVTLPKNVDRVFATVPTGTILVYTLSPEKIIGWNYGLRQGEKKYIDAKYHDLPDLGGAGKASINLEVLLKEKPDVLIEMTAINESNIEKADELQAKVNIPLVIIDEDIRKLDQAYKLLGEVLGQEHRSSKLSTYVKTILEDIEVKKASITEEMKARVYYAEGPKGLETEPSSSWHGELIDMVGGINVAQVEMTQVKGKTQVSIEQIIAWNPDIIIAWDDERGGYYSGILSDPIWQDIDAVKNERVYEIPNNPFNWFDRPPSANRILGLQWIGNLLYPEVYDYNMRQIVKEFYDEFYHYTLSTEEIDEILKNIGG